jgi:hypothetical protein
MTGMVGIGQLVWNEQRIQMGDRERQDNCWRSLPSIGSSSTAGHAEFSSRRSSRATHAGRQSGIAELSRGSASAYTGSAKPSVRRTPRRTRLPQQPRSSPRRSSGSTRCCIIARHGRAKHNRGCQVLRDSGSVNPGVPGSLRRRTSSPRSSKPDLPFASNDA